LYRKAGYEVAGSYCRVELRLKECQRFASELELDDACADDQPKLERLYAEVARERPGYLDRGPYAWSRVREYGGAPARAVVVRSGERVEGYAFVGQSSVDREHDCLRLTDFVAVTPAATRRLLDFLACHRSTVDMARWFGGIADQRLSLLPEKAYKVHVDGYWMSRIVDVPRALEQRGYPELEREVALRIDDPLLPENTGTFRLGVSRGRGSVARVTTGAGARLDVRALAALYTGFLTPLELVRAGMLEADASSLATLSLLFGGASPALSDYF
jgi:predicted acetyltransferase